MPRLRAHEARRLGLELCAHLACADLALGDAEREFLQQTATRFEVSLEETRVHRILRRYEVQLDK